MKRGVRRLREKGAREEILIYRVLEILKPGVCPLKLTFVWSTAEDVESRKHSLDVCHRESKLGSCGRRLNCLSNHVQVFRKQGIVASTLPLGLQKKTKVCHEMKRKNPCKRVSGLTEIIGIWPRNVPIEGTYDIEYQQNRRNISKDEAESRSGN
jgi:hypothetical protein